MNTQPALTAPAELPAAHLARIKARVEVARQALAPNTLRGYALDEARYRDWCQQHGCCPLPATAETVCKFLKAEVEAAAGKGKPYKVGTLRRRAASIASLHRIAQLPSPCDDALVRMELKALARQLGTGQRQAAPLTEREVLRIRARMGEGLRDLRDQALLLVGRDLLARASELVSLQVGDVQAVESGAVVLLRRRKTDTQARPYFIGPEAAGALAAWLDRAGIVEGALFRNVHKGGKAGANALTPRDVARVLKGRALQAQLPQAAGVSGHSLRVGMATDLVAANLEVAAVMQAGGWSTPAMVARYTAGLTAQRGAVARYYGARA